MTCRRIQELLVTDYIDGQADAAARKAVDGHLEACPSCREFREAVQKTEDVLRRPLKAGLSADVWASVRARIEAPVPGWRERLGLVWEAPALRPERSALPARVSASRCH